MSVKHSVVKVRPAWKTFLAELLSVRAGFYITQKPEVHSNKRGHLD